MTTDRQKRLLSVTLFSIFVFCSGCGSGTDDPCSPSWLVNTWIQYEEEPWERGGNKPGDETRAPGGRRFKLNRIGWTSYGGPNSTTHTENLRNAMGESFFADLQKNDSTENRLAYAKSFIAAGNPYDLRDYADDEFPVTLATLRISDYEIGNNVCDTRVSVVPLRSSIVGTFVAPAQDNLELEALVGKLHTLMDVMHQRAK